MLDRNLVLKSDELFLVGEIRTDGSGERASGLYLRDTRHLNRFDTYLNGLPTNHFGQEILTPTTAVIMMANQQFVLADGTTIPPHSISIQQDIHLDTELQVTFRVCNFGRQIVPMVLDFSFEADFRDLFDIRGYQRPSSGGVVARPVCQDSTITLTYRAPDGPLVRTVIDFDQIPTDVGVFHSDGRRVNSIDHEVPTVTIPDRSRQSDHRVAFARFSAPVDPRSEWQLSVKIRPVPADVRPVDKPVMRSNDRRTAPFAMTSDSPQFNLFAGRCERDLAALQTTFTDGRLPAAGIPWFVAPFGRDSLIVGLQTVHAAPNRASDTLRILAQLQGKCYNRDTEEEPGKILHEVRYGEMARLKEIPHRPYYGSVDATPLFVLLFAETVAWTADKSLYCEILPHVLRAIDWMEKDGDKDGDGLIEYLAQPSAAGHITHQGWKDSHDSLHDRDGRPVMGSIALVEVQGYAFAAYRRLAEVASWVGDTGLADRLRQKATVTRERVESTFWVEQIGFYAQALDSEKSPVTSVSSNPGHLLYCQLPSSERGFRVASRMTQSDMYTDWGVRTLSSAMATYNPMSYHNGSIWPHDNSLFADGARAYGLDAIALRTATALLTVAGFDPHYRLPELYCGFDRVPNVGPRQPVSYPVSCSPQAWAAGAGVLTGRTLLGLRTDLRTQQIIVDPCFPSWINSVMVEGMQAMGHSVSIAVQRRGDGYTVTADGPVVYQVGAKPHQCDPLAPESTAGAIPTSTMGSRTP